MRKLTQQEKAFNYLSKNAKIKIELDQASTPEEKFLICVKYFEIDRVQWFLDRAVDPNTVNQHNSSALGLAIYCPEIVRLLLERGADPNLQDNFGATPLHYIASSLGTLDKDKLLRSAELLMAAGADPNLQNNKGQKPIERINCLTIIKDQDFINELTEKFSNIINQPCITNNPLNLQLQSALVLATDDKFPAIDLTDKDKEEIKLYQENRYIELLVKNEHHQSIKKSMSTLFITSKKNKLMLTEKSRIISKETIASAFDLEPNRISIEENLNIIISFSEQQPFSIINIILLSLEQAKIPHLFLKVSGIDYFKLAPQIVIPIFYKEAFIRFIEDKLQSKINNLYQVSDLIVH